MSPLIKYWSSTTSVTDTLKSMYSGKTVHRKYFTVLWSLHPKWQNQIIWSSIFILIVLLTFSLFSSWKRRQFTVHADIKKSKIYVMTYLPIRITTAYGIQQSIVHVEVWLSLVHSSRWTPTKGKKSTQKHESRMLGYYSSYRLCCSTVAYILCTRATSPKFHKNFMEPLLDDKLFSVLSHLPESYDRTDLNSLRGAGCYSYWKWVIGSTKECYFF